LDGAHPDVTLNPAVTTASRIQIQASINDAHDAIYADESAENRDRLNTEQDDIFDGTPFSPENHPTLNQYTQRIRNWISREVPGASQDIVNQSVTPDIVSNLNF
jgi:hypothetical protein